METIVEIVGLSKKVDTILITKIPILEIPRVTQTNVEGTPFYSVDEVLVTLVNEVLSWTGAKID